MTLAMPVSSSMEMKMNPLAVPGRCRAMMQPAARTNSPSLRVFNSSAERMSVPLQLRAAVIHGMLADREPCSRVIRHQALFATHLRQRERFRFFPQPLALLPQQRPFRFARALHLPQRIAPVLDSVQLIQRADLRQPRQLSPIQRGNALGKILRGAEDGLPCRARIQQRLRRCFVSPFT